MKKRTSLLLVLAVVLFLVAGLIYTNNQPVQAMGTITIDVNPSVEIVVDENNQVQQVVAKNAKANEMLEGYTLGDLNLEVVAGELTQKLVNFGYLESEVENHILISGDARPESIETTQNAMSRELNNQNINANIVTTQLDNDDKYDDDSVSNGKYKLSKTISEIAPDLTVEELKNLTLGELFALLEQHNIEIPQSNKTTVVRDQDRLTRTEALEVALNHAGVTQSQIHDLDIEFDDGRWEVDFEVGSTDYDYDIHPTTGEILKVDIDHEDDDRNTGSTTRTVTRAQALEIALNHAGVTQSQIHDLDIEFDDGKWEVDFEVGSTDYDYDIHPTTGDIIKFDIDRDDEDVAPVSGRISQEEALNAALNHAGVSRSQIHDLDIDFDDGKWEVDFEVGSTDYEYDIHPTTGAILKADIEGDDDFDNNRPSQPAPAPAPTPTPAPTPAPAPTQPTTKTREEILNIALNHAGVSRSQIHDLDIDFDDGVWEIDFEVGETEYEFEIHPTSGKILDYDVDYD